MAKPSDPSKWKWLGHVQHFVGGHRCQWHMATLLPNGFLVSSCGDQRAKGHGDDGWTIDGGEEIGCGRKYETMVFAVSYVLDCGCPKIEGPELDTEGYMNHKDANIGHMKMCRKWARMPRQKRDK